MADALEPCTFMDGQNVVTQGDEGEDFFIIVEVCTVYVWRGKTLLWEINQQLIDLGFGVYM